MNLNLAPLSEEELLQEATRRSLPRRMLSSDNLRTVTKLVKEGKLVLRQPARFIYYSLPNPISA